MRQPYWKPQHEVFIRCMLKHEDPSKAYRTAYPKAKPASARVGGHRLYNYSHIRQRIEPLLRERKAEAHRKALEEGAERQRRQNERRMEMRHILYKVMMRQVKKKRNFIVNGQVVTIEEDPAIGTILNALTLDQRLEAGYDNWPVIEARFARIMSSLLPREKQVQAVIDSASNAIQAMNSPLEGGRQCAALTGGCRTTRVAEKARIAQTSPSAPLKGGTAKKQVHPVTISPTNPAQTHVVRNLKKARITKAVTKTIWPKLKETGKSA